MKQETKQFLRQWGRFSGVALVVSLLLGAPCVLVQWFVVSPYSSDAAGLFALILYFFLVLAIAVFSVPVCVVLLIFRATRKRSFFLLTGCVICVVVMGFAMRCGHDARMSAFHTLAKRSGPLVSAIKQYEKDHSAAPQALTDLVPVYLPEVLKTGMGAYPEYEYLVKTPEASLFGEPWPEGNAWVLYVFTPSGGINFDTFLYFPAQNYPQHAYSSSLERIGDWAYAHE